MKVETLNFLIGHESCPSLSSNAQGALQEDQRVGDLAKGIRGDAKGERSICRHSEGAHRKTAGRGNRNFYHPYLVTRREPMRDMNPNPCALESTGLEHE